jgi:chromosome segregation ATPase
MALAATGRRARTWWIIALAIAAVPALAQEDRERAALRRAQQQIAKFQQDNAALQREKAELEQKLKAAEEALAKAQAQAGRLGRTSKALAAAEKDNADLKARLEVTQTNLTQTGERCQADIAVLRQTIAQTQADLEQAQQEGAQTRARLQTALDAQTGRAETCEAMNLQLFSVTEDLIARYKENRGAWERFLLSEPFTQLKRAEVDNLLEEMREKAEAARVEAPPTDGAAETR